MMQNQKDREWGMGDGNMEIINEALPIAHQTPKDIHHCHSHLSARSAEIVAAGSPAVCAAYYSISADENKERGGRCLHCLKLL